VIATLALHVLARVAVRARPPLEAKRLVDALGSVLAPLPLGEAIRIGQELEGRGTCLSRALVIAARLPGAQVVIGAQTGAGNGFAAHAWVERDGVIVCGSPPTRHELARL
jgi:hypothetical protein